MESLRGDGYEPTVFFSNANIMPNAEYMLRLESIRKLSKAMGFELVEDIYDNAAWLAATRGLENAPEGGARCSACFRHNLGRAAAFASGNGFAEFTTTLTVSPHKRSATVFEAGDLAASDAGLSGDKPAFMRFDFKKRNGFLNSIKLSEHYGLYRQSWCGCAFSMRTPSNGAK